MVKIAQLTMRHGPFPDKIYPLLADTAVIGRATTCDIAIPDPEISRQHAQFLLQETDKWTVEDLGSTNGTFVNGRRAAGLTPLQSGDTIDFGEAIRFQFDLVTEKKEKDIPNFIIPGTGDFSLEESAVEEEPEKTDDPIVPAADWQESLIQEEESPEIIDLHADRPIIEQAQESRNGRRLAIILGCGFLLLICLCLALLLFLDGYDQGRVLYCGGLRPLWDTFLGPLGFAPACAAG